MTLHTFILPRIYLNLKHAKPLFTYPSWSDISHLNPRCGLQKQKDRALASYIIFYCSEKRTQPQSQSQLTAALARRGCIDVHVDAHMLTTIRWVQVGLA